MGIPTIRSFLLWHVSAHFYSRLTCHLSASWLSHTLCHRPINSPTTSNCSSAWRHFWRVAGHWQAGPLLGCCTPMVPAERPPAQRRQVRGRLAGHCHSAPITQRPPSPLSTSQVALCRSRRRSCFSAWPSTLTCGSTATRVSVQLPHPRHVRSLLTDDVTLTVACSIVASRLDYCNAFLCGAPAATFDKVQRFQNNDIYIYIYIYIYIRKTT